MQNKKTIFIDAKGYPKARLSFLNCDVFVNTTSEDTKINKDFDINCSVIGEKMDNGIAASITSKSYGLIEVVIIDNVKKVKGIFNIDKNFNNLEALISKAKKIFSKGIAELNIAYKEGKNLISKFGKSYVLEVNDLYDIDDMSKYEVVIDNLSERNKIVYLRGEKLHITSDERVKVSDDASTAKLDSRIKDIGFVASDEQDYIFYVSRKPVISPKLLLIINLAKLSDLSMLRPFSNKKFVNKIIASMKQQKELYITNYDFIKTLYDV